VPLHLIEHCLETFRFNWDPALNTRTAQDEPAVRVDNAGFARDHDNLVNGVPLDFLTVIRG